MPGQGLELFEVFPGTKAQRVHVGFLIRMPRCGRSWQTDSKFLWQCQGSRKVKKNFEKGIGAPLWPSGYGLCVVTAVA